jgi:GNAT superfamily N-acetyltransferase
VTHVEIPADVAFQAMNPSAAGPAPHPDSQAVRIMTEAWCVLVTSMPGLTFVERVRTTPEGAAAAVEEVRDVLRAHSRTNAAWCLDTDRQAEVLTELRRLGLTDYEQPPMEPTFAALALATAPAGNGGAEVEVRRAETLEEYLAVGRMASDVFGLTGADRDGMIESMGRRHAMERDGRSHMRQYVAFIDGEMVGEAQSSELDAGSNLSGSSVLPVARGRGVYRALVRARWDDAVARGRPALTVQAGAMSRPILERLGFVTVAEGTVLRDSFE